MGISVEDKARRDNQRAGWGHRRRAQAGCLVVILLLVVIPFVLARVLLTSAFGEAAGGYRYFRWFGIGVSGLNALLFMGLAFFRRRHLVGIWFPKSLARSLPKRRFLHAVAVSLVVLLTGLSGFFWTFIGFTFGLAVDQ